MKGRANKTRPKVINAGMVVLARFCECGVTKRRAQRLWAVESPGWENLAAGKPRVSPLVQLFQISQAVYGELLGIALPGGGQAFDIARIFRLESATSSPSRARVNW